MSLCIEDNKLLEKYKTSWSKIEDLKNIELDCLPVYDDRYIKNKIRTNGDIFYTNLYNSLLRSANLSIYTFLILKPYIYIFFPLS